MLREDLAVRTAMLLDPEFEPSERLVAEDRALAARVDKDAAVLPLAFVALTTESRNGTSCGSSPWAVALGGELEVLRLEELEVNSMLWLALLRPVVRSCLGDVAARRLASLVAGVDRGGMRPPPASLVGSWLGEPPRWIDNLWRCQENPTDGRATGASNSLDEASLLAVGLDAVRRDVPGPLTAIYLKLWSTAAEQAGCPGLPSLDLHAR